MATLEDLFFRLTEGGPDAMPSAAGLTTANASASRGEAVGA
jgi:hypothetical protein